MGGESQAGDVDADASSSAVETPVLANNARGGGGPPASFVPVFDRVKARVEPLETWSRGVNEFWASFEPPGHARRPQGWKLHVSATPTSMETVLERVLPILLRRRAGFKFAKGLDQVLSLVSMRSDRGTGGKAVTVYPDDDAHLRVLAAELHAATEGLDGPAILSDRPFRRGSLVHYRYGGFAGDTYLHDDGRHRMALVAPDGSWLLDERKAWFAPPPWAPMPFPDEDGGSPGGGSQGPVMLDNRFVVERAIRHSNRGGVYRATDRRTGEDVVLKEARPHVGADIDGTDARDWLRHEADMLDLLSPAGIAPRLVALFEYQGHTFLAEEQVPGATLRAWAQEAHHQREGGPPGLDEVVGIARLLLRVVRVVHAEGLVLRDLNPSNVMLTPDGRLILLDPEFLARPGDVRPTVMTLGYAAPEVLEASRRGSVPDHRADLYALGTTLFAIASGAELPMSPDDASATRTMAQRQRSLIDAAAASLPNVRALRSIMADLLSDDPNDRPSLDAVEERLDAAARAPVPAEVVEPVRLDAQGQAALLGDALAELVVSMTPDEAWLWPRQLLGNDPLHGYGVQGGAAGQVEVLRRALVDRRDESLREPLGRAVTWLAEGLGSGPRGLPGLYFGMSGAAWALHDAAVALDRPGEVETALAMARRLPLRWFNPDITHGLAGAGTAHLHLWRRTGDPDFRERTLACAEELVAQAEHDGSGGVYWRVGQSRLSELSGLRHYGYAHGVAGISAFLLAVAREFQRDELLETARAGYHTIVAVAKRYGDAVLWPSGELEGADDRDSDAHAYWCSGSAGIGQFLVRWWEASGDAEALDLAHGAAVAAHRTRWGSGGSHCHGLVGAGELMLDLAAASGDGQYRRWAAETAEVMRLRGSIKEGRNLLHSDPISGLQHSYNVGVAGSAAFLLRLCHGGPRSFCTDSEAFDLAPPDAEPARRDVDRGVRAGARA